MPLFSGAAEQIRLISKAAESVEILVKNCFFLLSFFFLVFLLSPGALSLVPEVPWPGLLNILLPAFIGRNVAVAHFYGHYDTICHNIRYHLKNVTRCVLT